MEFEKSKTERRKPLIGKVYGSIPHLPNSRLGNGDHYITFGQADILTNKIRDKHDVVIVQEKLDGACVGVVNIDGKLVPIQRRGYETSNSDYAHLPMFDIWVAKNIDRFKLLNLAPKERIIGEWLAFAHGTIYDLERRDAWAPFDIFGSNGERLLFDEFSLRVANAGFTGAPLISKGSSLPVDQALERLGHFGHYGAKEKCEGLVYRVERKGRVDFLAKFVHHDKIDGKYFPPHEPIWLWKP